MKLLAIDTSAKVAGAAVCTEDRIFAETTIDTNLTHSQTLMPICRGLLEHAKISIEEIDGFAIAAGPGSFTGLRIGMAAVKGMAFAQNKPCFPVSTLEALAFNLLGFKGIACPVMDARRNQVYNALFSLSLTDTKRLCEDRAIAIETLGNELESRKEPIWLCGDGAALCYHTLKERLSNIYLAPPSCRFQKASGVAFAAFAHSAPVTAEALMPQYLRQPQAERERAERLAAEQERKGKDL